MLGIAILRNRSVTTYTVKKGYRFSCPQPGCHWPHSLWPGKIKLFPARESLVSDIPAGDAKIDNCSEWLRISWTCLYDTGTKSMEYSCPRVGHNACGPRPLVRAKCQQPACPITCRQAELPFPGEIFRPAKSAAEKLVSANASKKF